MAQVDVNVQAILDEHRRELDLLAQRYQQEQQREDQRDQNKILQNFVKEHKDKINLCDGSSLRSVREWLRSISASVHRVPQGQNVDNFVIAVMKATCSGDLLDEIESHLRAAQAIVTHAQLRAHVNESFLGPDEANVLKDEVKVMNQGQREELPAFNRRFLKAADHAYPVPRDAQTEKMLTDRYLGSLMAGRIKDCCFNHDPRLVDLATATTVASAEWARQRRRQRIQREHTQHVEPMEVDSTDPPLRETLSAMASSIRNLQAEVKELNGTKEQQSTQPKAKRGACWYCGIRGHHQRECRKRKTASTSSPAQHQKN